MNTKPATAPAIVVLVLFSCLILGWAGAGTGVFSASDVEKQHSVVAGQYDEMITAADSACSAQEAAAGTESDGGAPVAESPIAAGEAAFRTLVSKYAATVDNPFEGEIVIPDGYPASADLAGLDTSDWCTVSGQLKALKD